MVKQILKIPIHKLDKPIFSFKRTNKASALNRKLLEAFNGNLVAEIKVPKGIPINYGSQFRDIAKLSKLFNYHDYKSNIINIIQKVSCYHLSSINEETRKSDPEEMIKKKETINHPTQK